MKLLSHARRFSLIGFWPQGQSTEVKNKQPIPIMKNTFLFATALAFAAVVPASYAAEETAAVTEKQDIVDVAAANADFSTLVAAVKAAGLVETLKGEGPFTVFAPTNEAFAALPAGTVEDLLKPENKEKLVKILTYHVVAGKVLAADVKAGEVATVQGGKATITIEGETVMIDGAKVTKTDIAASNGVIHVIDKVIMPKE